MSCPVVAATSAAAAAVWARAHLRDLDDRYAALVPSATGEREELAARIVAVSLRHRVLCRFTAWVAVDESGALVEGSLHRIVQPVETPGGWATPATLMAAPMAGWPAGPGAPGAYVGMETAPAPYQPPAPPGARPPVRVQRASRSLAPPPPPPPPPPAPATSAGADGRLDALLGAVQRLLDRVGSEEPLVLADEAARLATDRNVPVALAEALERLARALASGRPRQVRAATKRLREAADRHRRPARPALFWR